MSQIDIKTIFDNKRNERVFLKLEATSVYRNKVI